MKGVPGKNKAAAMEMSAEDTQISRVTGNRTAQRTAPGTAPAHSEQGTI